MIHQAKLTGILNPNKFKNCELKSWTAPIKSFSSIPSFLGHPVWVYITVIFLFWHVRAAHIVLIYLLWYRYIWQIRQLLRLYALNDLKSYSDVRVISAIFTCLFTIHVWLVRFRKFQSVHTVCDEYQQDRVRLLIRPTVVTDWLAK